MKRLRTDVKLNIFIGLNLFVQWVTTGIAVGPKKIF